MVLRKGSHDWQAPVIVAAYREGVPLKELLERFSVSSSTVYRMLRRDGKPLPGRRTGVRLDADTVAEAARPYTVVGLSVSGIAQKVGSSRDVVRWTLLQVGVALQPRVEAVRVPACVTCGRRMPRKPAQSG